MHSSIPERLYVSSLSTFKALCSAYISTILTNRHLFLITSERSLDRLQNGNSLRSLSIVRCCAAHSCSDGDAICHRWPSRRVSLCSIKLQHSLIKSSVSASSTTQFNSGGSITVGGTTIAVPENLLVQFPAAFIPFRDFAANGGQYSGFELSIDGNYVRTTVFIIIRDYFY